MTMKRWTAAIIALALAFAMAHGEEADALRAYFLREADGVTVTETSVIFRDDAAPDVLEIKKQPGRTVGLFASLTTLWYEAGGSVVGCIGGDAALALYIEAIGRDITLDSGMAVPATSASAKKWDVETIIALRPDLIICATSMNGWQTISGPAAAAGIDVIAVDYDDFADYLKWFKVFCHLTGRPDLWETVALPALDSVIGVLTALPQGDAPRVLCMFAYAESLQANTSNTVVGGMISQMHAVNIADGEHTASAERVQINLETVYAQNPDVILVQCHGDAEEAKQMVEATYGSHPVWQALDAVQAGRVYYLDKTLFHHKPNARFSEAYQVMADCIWP